jgi:hypothetical protein
MFIVMRESQMDQKPSFAFPLIDLLHIHARGSRHPFLKEDLVQIGGLDDLG